MHRALLALALISLAGPVVADETEDLSLRGGRGYLVVHSGVTVLGDVDAAIGGVGGKLERGAGWTVGAAIGWQFTDHLRAEFGFDYREVSSSVSGSPADWRVQLGTPMVAAYVDFLSSERTLRPYLGVGVGGQLASVKTPNSSLELEDKAISYAAMGGVTIRLGDATMLVAGYRFVGSHDLLGGVLLDSGVDVYTHDLTLGLRRNF